MLRISLQLFLATVCVFIAGCYPESTNPLSGPAASLFDERLPGVYEQRDAEEKTFWHFRYRVVPVKGQAEDESIPRLEVVRVGHLKSNGGLETDRFDALATRIGSRNYFSFIELKDGSGKAPPVTYGLARYEVNWLGEVRVWMASKTAFAEAVKSGQLKGKVAGDSVALTDSTERLAAFVAAADPKKLFNGEPLVLGRLPW